MGTFTVQSQNPASFVQNQEKFVTFFRESIFWKKENRRERLLIRIGKLDIPEEGVEVYTKNLCQPNKDRDADTVCTAFYLRVDAAGDVQIHKLEF